MDPSEITLFMIYNALEPKGLSSLIGIHPCSERACPVAQNIQSVLAVPYQKIEHSIRNTMESITLKSMIQDFHCKTCLRGGFIFGFVFKNVMAPKINGFPEVTMPQNCAYFTV